MLTGITREKCATTRRTIPRSRKEFKRLSLLDFALDINGNGEVVAIPRSKVVTCRTPCQLGVQLIPPATTKFDELYDAPKTGYTYDSLTVIPVGVSAVFVSKEVFCEPSNISTYDIYAKMIIDSVKGSKPRSCSAATGC